MCTLEKLFENKGKSIYCVFRTENAFAMCFYKGRDSSCKRPNSVAVTLVREVGLGRVDA
jgi:hypothetical protein